ncbi:MAG: AAA family ATPase [Gammaproteobacteria bacterium]|nr:AAA family ATPase [Gammaproteobacteria bacterium]
MRVSKEALIAVLSQFNPWWRVEAICDLPKWRRAAFRELYAWTTYPPAPRAALLSGARQIGKTTLMLQAVDALLREGVPTTNTLYATFDHPILKLAGIEAVLETWREREPKIEAHHPQRRNWSRPKFPKGVGRPKKVIHPKYRV